MGRQAALFAETIVLVTTRFSPDNQYDVCMYVVFKGGGLVNNS